MYKIKTLTTGLDIITAPIAGTKTVTVLVMAATGSRFENKTESGVSHFLEHMFFKGTVKRPTALAISSELDRVGGEFNAFTGKEYSGYWIKVAAGQLELALDVLSDILLHSKFSAAEIEREKAVITEELNMYLDNPLIYIEDLFEECLYGDTPAGRDTIGTKKTIANFSRGKIINYYSSQYSAPQALVCLAGEISPSALKLVEKYFKNFTEKKYRDKEPTEEAQDKPRLKLHFKKTDQAHLSLGVRALPHAHPDELTVKILSLLLGGSMSSRLFTELRERRGLAYYIRTHSEPYTDSGYLTSQVGVPLNKIDQAVKIILAEYKKISEQEVSLRELDKVKQCLIGRSALRLESSDNVASWYGRQMILLKEQNFSKQGSKRSLTPKLAVKFPQAEILTPAQYYDRLRKITAADVNRAAKKIFVEAKLNLAVIGPYRDRGMFEKMLKL